MASSSTINALSQIFHDRGLVLTIIKASQVSKTSRPSHPDPSHHKCFHVIGIVARELDDAEVRMEAQQAQHFQEMEQARSREDGTASQLRDMAVAKETAQAEAARLKEELEQSRQQLESAHAVMQGQISFAEIQQFLHQALLEMRSMTTRFGNGVDAFGNRVGLGLPGVIHGSWVDPNQMALPELPSSGDLPFPSSLPHQPFSMDLSHEAH
ncbi:hypothetical protein N7540_013027 [Penicillium herquei]|nr:hypothetical protein N7540_013027 [Penicillium herquei]